MSDELKVVSISELENVQELSGEDLLLISHEGDDGLTSGKLTIQQFVDTVAVAGP
jgi:hypothetical protein